MLIFHHISPRNRQFVVVYNIYNVAGETNPRGLHRFLPEGTSTLVDANVADTFSVSKSIQIKLCFVKWEYLVK